MTPDELVQHFNNSASGVKARWPKVYYVDAATFGNVAQECINHLTRYKDPVTNVRNIDLVIGSNNGIMFKGVEIILK